MPTNFTRDRKVLFRGYAALDISHSSLHYDHVRFHAALGP
jgi:hypothetical protein